MSKNNRGWMCGTLVAFCIGWMGVSHAEDVAAVSAVAAAAALPPAPAETAIEENLDNLEFASGEVTAFDDASKKLQVKVYLDDAGNPAENTIDLTLANETEITNGEKDLDATALKPGVEIDVEYDKSTQKATYVFVY